MERDDEGYFEDDPGLDMQDANMDDSPTGLWKLHRIAETNPELHEKVLDILQQLQPINQPLVLPELVEDFQEQPSPPLLGPQLFKKLTILVTGPVMIPGRDGKVVRILWDDVAQVLLQEDCLPSPITMRLLPPRTPEDVPTLITIIAAGGNEDWEGMRVMTRGNFGGCLEESGLLLRGSPQQTRQLASAALDSVDAVLYCDRLHKYHLTLSDQDLIKRLTETYGGDFWDRTVLCLTNDGYAFPPVGMAFDTFVTQRASCIAAEVASTGVAIPSRRTGGLLWGLLGGRRIHTMPTCVVDGNEMFIPPQEDGGPPLPLLPDGSWSPVNLLQQVVKLAAAGAAFEYPQQTAAPSEGVDGRVVPQLVIPPPKKPEPKAPRARKQPAAGGPGGGQLGAGMPGFPGAKPPGFGPQGMQWEMQVQGDRLKLQERRKEVEAKGWLRSSLRRMATTDLKWLPYVVIAQVMLYRRVFLPLVKHFREKDLHYVRMEYEAKKVERERIGMQPPRGLEVGGVYIDEPWSEGERYVARLERLKKAELAKLQGKQ